MTDDDFERVLGSGDDPDTRPVADQARPNKLQGTTVQWSWQVTTLVFFAVGVYGGSIQAGIGLILIVALTRAGIDIVTTNHIKVIVTFVYTVFTLPVFIVNGDVYWLPATVLAAGLAAGAVVGARITVAGGERVVRPVLVIAVVAMSGHLLGRY